MSVQLFGVHEEIDRFIGDLALFGKHLALRGFMPANAGDVSLVLSVEAGEIVLERFGQPKRFFPFSHLSELVEIRDDGRHYFNAESFPTEVIQGHIRPLAGRLLVITVTGAKLWDVERDAGRRLCIVEVSSECDGISIVYGNEEYGTIPSIETASHLVANAVNFQEGHSDSSVLHCHPQDLVAVGAHTAIGNSYAEFNKTLYTQKEGVLTNVSDLIGVVPYHPSGSRALFEESVSDIYSHRFLLWQRHGVLIREQSLERCVDLLEYAEDAAAAAIRSIMHPDAFQGLTHTDLQSAVNLYGLSPAILDLTDE